MGSCICVEDDFSVLGYFFLLFEIFKMVVWYRGENMGIEMRRFGFNFFSYNIILVFLSLGFCICNMMIIRFFLRRWVFI